MNLLSLTLAGMTSFGMFDNHKIVETSPMFPEAPILQKYSIKGSEDKEYICYDVEHGYSIYLKTVNGLVFCEGSYQTNSPYYLRDTKGEDLYYFGLGNYFVGSENCAKSLLSQTAISPKNILAQKTVDLIADVSRNSGGSKPDTNTHVDAKGFRVIERDQYFRHLTYFPQNWFGECGLIALSEMLSYLDTFENDGFIPNGKTYGGRDYNTPATTSSMMSSSPGDAGYTDNPRITTETLIRKAAVYSTLYKEWDTMPGTNYSMRDYLFDKYMHTFMNIRDYSKGFPMMDGELKNTFNDYVNANCNESIKNHYEIASGHIWNIPSHVKECVNNNQPVAAVLRSYTTIDPDTGKETDSGDNHVVMVYGYKDDQFLANFGWWPNYNNYTQIVIGKANIYGYFSVKYTGNHVHSSNAIYNKRGLCGCGYIS